MFIYLIIAPCRCRGLGVRFPITIIIHDFPTVLGSRSLSRAALHAARPDVIDVLSELAEEETSIVPSMAINMAIAALTNLMVAVMGC
jgi:hypothetical protein